MHRLFLLAALLFFIGCVEKTPNLEQPFNFDIAGLSKDFAEPMLLNYHSCHQLNNDLKAKASQEIQGIMDSWPEDLPAWNLDPVPGSAGPGLGSSAPPPMAPAEGIDFSGTNNQEKGVDEADIIKTDGRYFYLINNNKFEVLSIVQEGQLNLLASLNFDYELESLLIIDNKAVLFSSGYWPRNLVRIDVINLGDDRQNISLEKSHFFEGHLKAARKIGKNIHIATYAYDTLPGISYWPELPANFYVQSPEEQERLWDEAKIATRCANEAVVESYDYLTMLPSQLNLGESGYSRLALSEDDCAYSYGSIDNPNDKSIGFDGFLGLFTLNFAEDEGVHMQWVRSQDPTVYASPDQIIIASTPPVWGPEAGKHKTTIHRFKIGSTSLPDYADSVDVAGALHNSFSLSEYAGYVRVATTLSSWSIGASGSWEFANTNQLYILGEQDGKFSIISSLENLAPGEKIWSARFSKDKGFLVTFKQVDPLFTLDLSDPFHPVVAGTLKVPGVSTYLQDIGNGQLLAVGYGGNEEGLNWQTSLSLFDVSDFFNPKLSQSMTFNVQEGLDGSWSSLSSEANRNHLAINYFGAAGITAIPVYTDRIMWGEESEEAHWEFISKLMVVNTKANQDLSMLGQIDHAAYYQGVDYWYDVQPQIRRSYFVGDYLYAFSSRAISATKLADMTTTSSYLIK